MLRARKSGVLTPCIFFVENDAATIFMERIEGQSVRDILLLGNLAPAGIPAFTLDSWALPACSYEPSCNPSSTKTNCCIFCTDCSAFSFAEVSDLLQKIGRLLATLHDAGLIHGDLTTSNMLVRDSDTAVVGTEARYSASTTLSNSASAIHSATS